MYEANALRHLANALDECRSPATRKALLNAIETWVEQCREEEERSFRGLKDFRREVYSGMFKPPSI